MATWPYMKKAAGWKVTSLLLIQSPTGEHLQLVLDEDAEPHETIANGGGGWLREMADAVNASYGMEDDNG